MLSAYTPVQQVGLSIATASLVIGFFFFLYSMKYYFSLALVLSYSRKPLAEGEGFTLTVSGQVGKSEPGINGNINNINGTNGNGKGLLGFLGKVFGVNG